MLTDSQELGITTDSSEVVNAINGFFEQLLSVGNDSQVILKAVEADPTCAIANAQFNFSKLERAIFDNCNLDDSTFLEASLTNVKFMTEKSAW